MGDIQFTIMQQNTIIPQNSKQCPSTKKWQAKQNLLENDLFYILRVTTRFHSRLEAENETIWSCILFYYAHEMYRKLLFVYPTFLELAIPNNDSTIK